GGGGVESIQSYLVTRLGPLLIGQDPLMVERLWERMYRADRGIKRQGVAAYALSALDIALWDIVGKAARLPLYKLWGAVTDRVPAYGSGGLAQLLAGGPDRRGAGLRGARLPLLQDEDPPPRPAREPLARGDGEEGGRGRRAHHGRREPEARRDGQHPPGAPARGSRPGLVRGAGARRRPRRVRGGGGAHRDPGGDRREQLHALRVPRPDRAPRGPVPDARHLPGERVQRYAQDRPARRRAPGRGVPSRGPRAVAPGRGRAVERIPGRVDRLGTGRPLRADAGDGGRRLPDPRPPGARHDPGAGGGEEVPPGLTVRRPRGDWRAIRSRPPPPAAPRSA